MSLLVAALAVCVLPGVADAKKKRDKIGLATYNLYLGSDLDPATEAGLGNRTDLFADEVGFVRKDVDANSFDVRAKRIAKDIKKRKVDLVGLQEAALWKIQLPTDGGAPSPANPGANRAGLVTYDYIDKLLEELNRKAKTKKQCGKRAKKRKAHGKKPKKCFRGYKLVIEQQEADLEFPADFDNNPGPDGVTFDVSSTGSLSNPAQGPAFWLRGNDDTGVSFGEPPSGPGQLPQDANFDSHQYAALNGGVPNGPFDGQGNGTDPAGTTDCSDNKNTPGPAQGNDPDGPGPFPPWPFDGYGENNVPVCMFHGIDGDLSLTMRDAIIKRKGAGVKTRNSTSGNYSPGNMLAVSVFGSQVQFTRGWTATEAKVRGKSFKFVNTHLESNSTASLRENQASELIAPGGPATAPKTVLVGDLNSDPNRPPTGLPNSDGGSNIAINRLFAGGFEMLTPSNLVTGGHGELLSDRSNVLDNGFIDHILTNAPKKIRRKGKAQVIDSYADGLWNSDHGGVYVRIQGKKRN